VTRFAHRAVPIVLAAVLIDTIGFGVAMPVLPSLLTRIGHIGIDQATRVAGYMLAVFAIGQFFAGPVLGNLSDRFGRRSVLIASMLAYGLDYALMGLAPTLAWFFLGRAIAGIAGAVAGPAGAVIADVTPPEERASVFALLGAAFGMGFVIGPGIGGLIAGFGDRAPFLFAGGLALLNALVMWFAMPETLQAENRRAFHWRDAHIIGAFRPIFHSGNAAPLLLALFLWQLGNMVYPATWGFWATIRFGWNAQMIGLSLTCVGLITALFQALCTGPIIQRIGVRRALIIGMIFGTLTTTLYALVDHSWQAFAVLLVMMPAGLVGPAITGMLSRLVDATRQGALQGGTSSIQSVASVVSPLMLTQALAVGAAHGFPGAAFFLAALLSLAALLLVGFRVHEA
jgi:DHA1 family tetracycline resistance protein-like MFS transporter